MAHWKRRRSPKPPAVETAVGEADSDELENLRRQLAGRTEEIAFLRAQLAQALGGWREAQHRLLALEAEGDDRRSD